MKAARLSIIVAVARNGVIGRDGDLPWRLPADMKWFKDKTMGHHVIMGRRTFESLAGHTLPGRKKIVLTRRAKYDAAGCVVVSDLGAAIDVGIRAGDDELFVIGGAGVYEEALPLADRVYLTRVEADVEGDTVLKAFAADSDQRQWNEVWREEHAADDRHDHAFSWRILERHEEQ